MFKQLALVLSLTLAPFAANGDDTPLQPEAQTASPSAHAGVPKLVVGWNCEKCHPANPKVPPLVEQFYKEAAARDGRAVDEGSVVDGAITTFRQRNPGLRVMVGIMAGKDKLILTVTYKGTTFTAGDYSANAIEGMNALCESVAKDIYKKIVAIDKTH